MLLGNINYLIQKMSSTVVSSLMTSVPIIADARVLASYTFLQPEHVFVMGPKETELDVMQRVSGAPLQACGRLARDVEEAAAADLTPPCRRVWCVRCCA
jgi:hypothetical protein